MTLDLTIFSSEVKREKQLADQIREILQRWSQRWTDVTVREGTSGGPVGQIVFIDGISTSEEKIFQKFERKGRTVYLIVDESAVDFPQSLTEGKVDDLILSPLRPLEIVSKIQNYEQHLLWAELHHVNSSISEVLSHLQSDLSLAERIHKAKLPKRFIGIPGFEVFHRYLAGTASGGDYFDLAETEDKSRLSMVLSRSSSYGLSSSILAILMRVCMKLTVDQLAGPGATSDVVGRIYQEIILTLAGRDTLSLLFGTFERATLILRLTHFGEGVLFYAPPSGSFQMYRSQNDAISNKTPFIPQVESQIQLHLGGRLVVMSGGLVTLLGGAQSIQERLAKIKDILSQDMMNEMIYHVKSKLPEDEMIDYDCTVVIFEVGEINKPLEFKGLKSVSRKRAQ